MPNLSKISPYQQLCRSWANCQRCPLSQVRKQVVMARGTIPADVVFVGEAPGDSEDVLGSPFVGPAGKLLDSMIADAEATGLRLAWFNVVGCIPKSEATRRKNAEPLPEEIRACSPRITRFLDIAKPRLVVAVGEVAKKQMTQTLCWGRGLDPQTCVTIIHPASILKNRGKNQSQCDLLIQRTIVQLGDAFEGLRNG